MKKFVTHPVVILAAVAALLAALNFLFFEDSEPSIPATEEVAVGEGSEEIFVATMKGFSAENLIEDFIATEHPLHESAALRVFDQAIHQEWGNEKVIPLLRHESQLVNNLGVAILDYRELNDREIYYELVGLVRRDWDRINPRDDGILLPSIRALRHMLRSSSDNALLQRIIDDQAPVRYAATFLAIYRPNPAFDYAVDSRLTDMNERIRSIARMCRIRRLEKKEEWHDFFGSFDLFVLM